MVPELRVRLGPYTSRFPAGEEGRSWQRGKPGLVEIGFPSLVGLQPPRALLLFFCSSPWVRPGWGCRPCSLLRAGGWCERGSCPHITLPIPFTIPSWDWEQELATREMGLSKEASCLLRLSLGDRAKDDDCSFFGAPSG